MKRYDIHVKIFVDAEHIDAMWEKFRAVHEALNAVSGDGYYEAEVIEDFDLRHEGKSELN